MLNLPQFAESQKKTKKQQKTEENKQTNTKSPRATTCLPEWNSHCLSADTMQQFSNTAKAATHENMDGL